MPTLGVTETEGAEPSQLVAGDLNLMKPGAVASGEGKLVRGAVLALNSSNKWIEPVPAAGDITAVARGILAADVDAASADANAEIYLAGKYRLTDLIWPSGITDGQKNTALLDLQDRGIVVDADFV